MSVDDELERLLASVVARYGDIVASDAVVRAFAVASRDMTPPSRATVKPRELRDNGRQSIPQAAFDHALRTELRRLLLAH